MTGRYIPAHIRKHVWARDGGVCQIRNPGCMGEAQHIDHITPWAVVREHNPDDMRLACAKCNQGRPSPQRRRGSGGNRTQPLAPRSPHGDAELGGIAGR